MPEPAVVASGREGGGGWGGRGGRVVGIGALVVAVVAAAIFEILLSRAEPILRARLVQSLSARFHSRVESGASDVSRLRGFEVSGKDLAVYPYNVSASTPMFSVRRFAFRTGYSSLVHSPLHIGRAEVEGLRINLPPKSQRNNPANLAKDHLRPAREGVSATRWKATIPG